MNEMKDFILVQIKEDTIYLLCLPESNLLCCLEQAKMALSSDDSVQRVIVDRLLISGDCDDRLLVFRPKGGRLEIGQAKREAASREINDKALEILERIPTLRAIAPITDFEIAELQRL